MYDRRPFKGVNMKLLKVNIQHLTAYICMQRMSDVLKT